MEITGPKDIAQMEMAQKVVDFWEAYGKGPRRHRKTTLTDDEKRESLLGAWVQRHNKGSGLAQDFLDTTLGKKWRSTTEVKLQTLEKKMAKESDNGDIDDDDSWINYNGSLCDPFHKRCPWFIRAHVPIPPVKSLTTQIIKKKKKKQKLMVVKKEEDVVYTEGDFKY